MSPIIKQRLITGLKILVLAACGFGVYARVLNGPFVFDDIFFIERNPAIKHLDRFDTIFISNVSPLRFLPFLSFALNYYFHQLDTFGYHLLNVIIHIFNSLLVFSLVSLTCRSAKVKTEKYCFDPATLAFVVALAFLLHPVQTQAVSYITQRFASMAAMFYLSCLCFYALYRSTGKGRYLPAVLLCGLGAMFSKQISLTLPLTLIVYDRLFYPSSKKGMMITAIIAGILALIIPAYYSFDVMGFLKATQPSKSHIGDTLTSVTYFLTQFRVIMVYLKILAAPVAQNFLYDFPASASFFEVKVFLSALCIVAFLASAIYAFNKDRLISFGILWFFITLSVESSVIQIGHVIFEHRVYLPSFGFLLAVCALLARLLKSRKSAIVIFSAWLIFLSALTYHRNAVYTDKVVFWQDVLKKSPKLLKPYLNLGKAYFERGDFAESLSLYNQALEIDPDYEEALNNKGLIYMKQGRYSEALFLFNRVLEIDDQFLNAYHNRGVLYIKLKQN